MRSFGMLLATLAAAGCAKPPAAVSGDPASLHYAPALGIDLTAMTRTESGLYYQDVRVGDGPLAGRGRTCTVHYTGWLADGRKFDSSRDRGVPFSFTVGAGQVIRGWDEGVSGMKVGGVRRLVIPAALGYGAAGAGGAIPPGAVLVFEVELVESKD